MNDPNMAPHDVTYPTATTEFALHEMTRFRRWEKGTLAAWTCSDCLLQAPQGPPTRRTNNRCAAICTTGEANTTGPSQHQAHVRLSSPIALHLFNYATHLSAFCPLHKYCQRQACKCPLSYIFRLSHTITSRPSCFPSRLPFSPFFLFSVSPSLPSKFCVSSLPLNS